MSTLKIELNKTDVQEAIADFVNRNYGRCTAKDVFIDVGMEYEDRPCGSSYPALKRVVVTLKQPDNISGILSSFEG